MRDHPLTFLALASSLCIILTLAGCGGGDDTVKAVEVDVDEVASSSYEAPALAYYPRVVGLFVEGDAVARQPLEVLGNIPLITTPFPDGPELLGVSNQVLVGQGQLVSLEVRWRDIGADVDTVLVELRSSQTVLEGPRYVEFGVPELTGLADGTTTMSMRVDPLNEDGGYEYVLAYRDSQGNLSTIIRGVFIQSPLAEDPALGAVSRDLVGPGGDSPPNLGPTQLWFPNGGVTEDSIPDGLEGGYPERVSSNTSMMVQQPGGTNAFGLQDGGDGAPNVPRTGVIYGEGNQFTYLFNYLVEAPNSTCGEVWAHLGVGSVIEEDRETREDKRLEINELRVFLGTFQPGAEPFVIRPPGTPMPRGCAGVTIPIWFFNDSVIFLR